MLKYVEPDSSWKEKAIDYIQEFYQYQSPINGTGGLQRYLEDYEGWLHKLEAEKKIIAGEDKVPARTYFLVREEDERIVGIVNIRLALNERLQKHGGNIGYSIRPTERRKGYNKVNLYLALKVCQEHGLKEALLHCHIQNPASRRTMLALGAKKVQEYCREEGGEIIEGYLIDVNRSLLEYQEVYEPQVKSPTR